jgi:hypothetical protein
MHASQYGAKRLRGHGSVQVGKRHVNRTHTEHLDTCVLESTVLHVSLGGPMMTTLGRAGQKQRSLETTFVVEPIDRIFVFSDQ